MLRLMEVGLDDLWTFYLLIMPISNYSQLSADFRRAKFNLNKGDI